MTRERRDRQGVIPVVGATLANEINPVRKVGGSRSPAGGKHH